ncbi:MAG TPA: methyltransferase domain-containing protein [Streptosporangiaceae bacterium]|nr:methyltransferase domain-containing protein [Streptosporangiaceae bacterium]
MTTYTERDVEAFFDQTLRHYLDFWDSEGVLHTGIFASDEDEDYAAAADRTSAVLADQAGIDAASRVLDAGCGCGNFATYLAERFGCQVEGLDLSEERVSFATQRLASGHARVAGLVTFRHGSVTQMPYDDGTFTHVVSQDALFLVPDKPRSHAEIFRVLRPGGRFACSDFLQPSPVIGEQARKHVYDRVRWNGGFSLAGYQDALSSAGFSSIAATDLQRHIKQTYRVLGAMATERAQITEDAAGRDWMRAFAESCEQIQAAIGRGEFGWGMFVARKGA